MTVKDRVAIVTGSGQGLGLRIAQQLIGSGAKVVLNDVDPVRLQEAAAAFPSDSVAVYAGDVSQSEHADALVAEAITRWGRIDILVNNAGIARDRMIHKMSDDDWDDVLRVNLRAPFLCTRAALTHMREAKYGRIVNVGSRAWLGGLGQANYSASKGGLISLTRTTALEGARYGVTANCVVPALMQTPLFDQLEDENKAKLTSTVPMGRVADPGEIAWMVEQFASDEASYVTGQHLAVCGGRSLGASA